MSTRERAVTAAAVTVAAIGWIAAATITIALGDLHKAFVLIVMGASILTFGLIVQVVARSSSKALSSDLSDKLAEMSTQISQKALAEVATPIESVHQNGIKFGWDLAHLQHPELLAGADKTADDKSATTH